MAEFLISPPGPTQWSLPGEQFAKAVIERWPRAGVRRWADGAPLRASAWVSTADAWDDLLLELHGNGHTLGIDVRAQWLAAEVACWWRRLVPSELTVIWLYDRGFSGYSSIWPDTTPAELFPNAPR